MISELERVSSLLEGKSTDAIGFFDESRKRWLSSQSGFTIKRPSIGLVLKMLTMKIVMLTTGRGRSTWEPEKMKRQRVESCQMSVDPHL